MTDQYPVVRLAEGADVQNRLAQEVAFLDDTLARGCPTELATALRALREERAALLEDVRARIWETEVALPPEVARYLPPPEKEPEKEPEAEPKPETRG